MIVVSHCYPPPCTIISVALVQEENKVDINIERNAYWCKIRVNIITKNKRVNVDESAYREHKNILTYKSKGP